MAHHLPRLPLGISDFAKLHEAGANYLYVDKTLPLFNLLDAGNYLFLARPRRFGKSLLCSTLKYLHEGRRELYTCLAIEPLWDWTKHCFEQAAIAADHGSCQTSWQVASEYRRHRNPAV
jgi:hypothetical protein